LGLTLLNHQTRSALATTTNKIVSFIWFPIIAKLCTLFVFGFLAFTPSKECGRCLITKFGLTQFAARLFWRLVKDKRRVAFDIFDALPPHTAAVV
jgi:hypothetical protein